MRQRLFTVALLLFVTLITTCRGGSSTPGDNDSEGGGLSTTPTPTWGDLIVDVATKTSPSSSSNLISSNLATPLPRALSSSTVVKPVVLEEDELIIDEIRLVVRDIRFELASDRYSTPRLTGPFIVNLVQNREIVDESTPEMGKIRVVPETYDHALLRLTSLDEEEIPDELQEDEAVTDWLVGNSIVIFGSFLEYDGIDIDGDGGVSYVPFVFLSDTAETIEITTDSPFAVLESVDNTLYIAFKVYQWFADALPLLQEIDPAGVSFDDEGHLVLWDEGDTDLLDIVGVVESSIWTSFGFAFEEEEDVFGTSGEEDENFDDECYLSDEEDWEDPCLEENLSCEDDCYEVDCYDDENLEWQDQCIEEQDQCVDDCWGQAF